MTKKLTKIFGYALGTIVLTVAILVSYTQTGAFRANVRSLLYEVLESSINGKIYIGELSGNIFNNFSIDTLAIYVDDAPVLATGRVSVHFRPISLLKQKINIDSLVIEHPLIYLTRWSNGSWNIDRLSASTTQTDSTPSAWMFVARQIRLINGSFRMVDSTKEYASSIIIDGKKTINYSNIFLTQVNLSALAIYSTDKLEANISHLSFTSPQEEFTLNKLTASCSYTKDSARVSGLKIQTPRTALSVSAHISGIDVFSVNNLAMFEHAPVFVAIDSSVVAVEDVQAFLPELYFLKGNVRLNALFQGTFQQLNVKKLNASFASTDLHLTGTVSNIHQPKELHLNIVSQQSSINPPDVPALLPYFNIPLYKQLGKLTVDFQYVGKPLDFMVISKIKSDAGAITVDGEMIITEDNLHYKGLLTGHDVNLEKIFETADVASRLNTKAYIQGEGTSIDKLSAEAKVEIDSSVLRGIPVSSALLQVKAKDKIIDTEISLHSPEGSVQTTALLDFRMEEPAYMLSARARDINLAPILNDEYYRSRISFDLYRSSRSLRFFEGASNTSLYILPSVFRQYTVDSSLVKLQETYEPDGVMQVSFISPVADGELRGKFTFNGFISLLKAGVGQFYKVYAYQRGVVDTAHYNDISLNDTLNIVGEQVIAYNITVKNLTPVTAFFNLPEITAHATLKGELRGNAHQTGFKGNIALTRGAFIHDSTIIQARDTEFKFLLEDIPSLQKYHLPLKVELALQGNEIAINRTSFHYPKLNIAYDGMQGNYAIYTDIDTTVSIGVEGTVDIHAEGERFIFSTMRVTYQGFEIENAREFSALLSKRKIEIDSAVFVRRDESFLLHGSYEFGGMVNVAAVISNFAVNDLYYLNTSPAFRENALALNGTLNAQVQLTGVAEDPEYSAHIHAEGLSFYNNHIGNLSADFQYKNRVASIKVEVRSSADLTDEVSTQSVLTDETIAKFAASSTKEDLQPEIYLAGSIPIDLRLVKVERRTAEKGMDVRLTTSTMQIAPFDPFIPEIRNVQGQVRSAISFTGSLDEPVINGTMYLDSGSFVFEMTGIPYLASGTLKITQNRITFSNFSIANLSSDFFTGRMNVGGYIALTGFTPNEYHLRATGELLVLHERSRAPGSNFFGRLIASTETDSLRFDGTFERSQLSGTIFVQQASLTFPPSQQASSYSTSKFGDVEFINDTLQVVRDTTAVKSLAQFAEQLLTPPKTISKTFLDGFGYEVTIITRGSVHVNMIFNANVGAYEELFADLNGKLILRKDETGQHFTGTINVGSGSTYEFYKKFNATGSLTFVGDPQNPQLNILAEYEGTHLKDPLKATDEERVIVSLEITGTRLRPEVKIGLSTIDPTGKEIVRTGEVENDAIAFLLTSAPGTPGKFRDELTTQDRNRIGEQLYATVGGTFINSMLSGAVMDFIKKNNIPFVKRFEVSEVGVDPNISVSFEISDAIINAGGRVFSNVNNTNINVQLPILGKNNRNFMLEAEKKTENFTYSLESRTIFSARIFYRFTF